MINNKHARRRFFNDDQEYKECTKCEEAYPHTEDFFNKSGRLNKSGDNVLRGDCKVCFTLAKKIVKQTSRLWLDELKRTKKCSHCGLGGPKAVEMYGVNWIRALQFNHEFDKCFNIGDAVRNGYGKDTILKELEKGFWLCANCHSVYTFN